MLQHDSHTVTSRTMQGILRDGLFSLGGGQECMDPISLLGIEQNVC